MYFCLSLWKPHFVHSLSIGFDAHNLCKAVMLLHQLENNFKVPFRGIGLLGSCMDACLIFFSWRKSALFDLLVEVGEVRTL